MLPVTHRLLRAGWLAAAILALPRPAAAQQPQGRAATARLMGTVIDSGRRAIDRAEVFWTYRGREVAIRTDSAGSFNFGYVPPGSYRVSVRRLGYQPRVLSIGAVEGEGPMPAIVLDAMPRTFEEIRVVARVNESGGKLREFYERRAQKNHPGYFFDEAQIGRYGQWLLSEYLRAVPGVTLTPSRRLGNVVRFRSCQPMIWLDGVRTPNAELDELIGANDVAAMEVYVSPAAAPAQFRDLDRPCGSIVLWTRT